MTKAALVYTPIFLGHDTGEQPENSGRLIAIMGHLDREGLLIERRLFEPEAAPFEALAAVHTADLIEEVLDAAESGGRWLDGDTYVSPGSYEAAVYGAGAAMIAVDAALQDDPPRVFVMVRPPGHHATVGRAMGFCLFNHVAVAAQYALDGHGLERVAIIDWDVHHGNGTQDIFYASGRAFYASVHQMPLYPGSGRREETGSGHGEGKTLNVPLPPGAEEERYFQAFDNEILPAVRAFQPQLIFVSAGFDAHKDDPLAMQTLTEASFAGLTQRVCQLADECCQGRIVMVLEGGYNHDALARSVAATLRALDGEAAQAAQGEGEQ